MNEYNLKYEEAKVAPSQCNLPLNELMNMACAKAQDALRATRMINAMLFGAEKIDEKGVNPMSFENALQNHDATLTMLCEELLRMAGRLGC